MSEKRLNDLVRLFDRDLKDKQAEAKKLGRDDKMSDTLAQMSTQFEKSVDLYLAAVDDDVKERAFTRMERLHARLVDLRPQQHKKSIAAAESFKEFYSSRRSQV